MKSAPPDYRKWIARGLILAVLIALASGFVFLWNDGFFDGGDPTWWILGGLFALGLLPLLGRFFRRRNRDVIVLWCRRFSKPDLEVGRRNRWIWAVITEACRDLAVPVTLRDRSLAGSQSAGRAVQNPLAILLILVATPLWLWGMLAVFSLVEGSTPEAIACLVGLAVYIGMFRVIGSLTIFLTGTLATFDGNPGKIEKRLDRIRKMRFSRNEMDVIRCTDEMWQACVLAVLGRSDCVIIDNVDCSENIEWEIRRSIEAVGKARVFMLLRMGASPPEDISPVLVDLEKAGAEIEGLTGTWGEDDFGEVVELGDSGRELAETLRDRVRLAASS